MTRRTLFRKMLLRTACALGLLASSAAGAAAGDDLFKPYVNYPLSQGANGVAIGDVTGDGLNDLVAVQASLDSVYVYVQSPSGMLNPPIRYPASITYVASGSVDIADLNHDGRLDVLLNLDNAVGVMLQTAGGTLSGPDVYPTDHESFSNTYLVRSGDLNHDGWADAVSIDWGTQSDDVDIFLQNAAGVLVPTPIQTVEHEGYDDLEVGDVTGDGLDDIIVMNGQGFGPCLGILRQRAGGGFDPAVYYALGSFDLTSGVGVGDVNHDGRNDVLVSFGGNAGRIGVFLQDALGNLTAPFILPSLDIPEPIEVADVNKDGRDDVVVLHAGWLHLGVYLQGAGALQPEQLYPIPYTSHYNPHGLAIGDLNHDTWSDVAIGDGLGVTILYSTAPGATAVLAALVSAESSSDRVDLVWELGGDATTATVQRSDAPGDWQAVGTGVIDGEHRVHFTDRDVVAGGHYGYRLSFQEDGTEVLAGEVWVDVQVATDVALALHGTQPNPSDKNLNVSFTLPVAAAATLELLDVSGRRIVSRDVGALGAGTHAVDMTPRQALVSGVYWLRLTQGSGVRTAKAIVR